MTDSIIDNRRSIRPRLDATAIHRSANMSETVTTSLVKLDVVANKITMTIPSTLTVNLNGSIDGSNFFVLATGANNEVRTYGTAVGNHLTKYVQVVWVAGTGAVVIAA